MTILSAHEQEVTRQKRIKAQIRAIEDRKFKNPDRDPELEGVWAAYVWADGEWIFAGFRRRRNRRKPQTMGRFFGKIRRQLNIDKKAPVKLMDLGEATRLSHSDDQSWRIQPPTFQQRKPKMEQRTPVIDRTKRKTKAKQRAFLLNKKTTKYLALGKNSWEHKPGHLYLGPLTSTKKRSAQFEARRMFPVYTDLVVIGTDELSKSMRQAMARSKRVQAGITRIQWPEVPPTFGVMWDKMVKRLLRKEFGDVISPDDLRWVDIEMALREEWDAQGNPWLTLGWFRKQIKPWRLACAPKSKAKRTKGKSKGRFGSVARKKLAAKKTSVRRKPRKQTIRPKRSSPKRNLRSIVSRVRSAISSVRSTKRKTGPTRRGSSKKRTSGRGVLVVRAKLPRAKSSGKTSARSSKRASKRRSRSRTLLRIKTSASLRTSGKR